MQYPDSKAIEKSQKWASPGNCDDSFEIRMLNCCQKTKAMQSAGGRNPECETVPQVGNFAKELNNQEPMISNVRLPSREY